MTAQPYVQITQTEFEEIALAPENLDRILEFINEEIVETMSNPYSSKITMRFARHITPFVDDNNLGHITGEGGGYFIGEDVYVPDLAFVSSQRQQELEKKSYNRVVPDLALEVISSGTKAELERLRIKISGYLAAGVTVWVADWENKTVEVHAPGQPAKIYRINDVLGGGNVLPGFSVKLSEIFK
ncbi:MAG: Uma2 family endonuclease [Phototrophicaceae bacterium]|jgi:Uma2 family endonuclease